MTNDDRGDEEGLKAVERLVGRFHELRKEISKVIVGQDAVVEELLLAIFARGHCILEGVPGLAKTLLVRTLARCLRLDFSRTAPPGAATSAS